MVIKIKLQNFRSFCYEDQEILLVNKLYRFAHPVA